MAMTTARVLVVDDDVRIAASVRRSLSYEGHEVFVAHDGPDGLEAARSLGPDVIVTPPALAGLVSPFGGCPLGSISVARTAEMIHVWTLPGVEEPFGEIDQEWLAAYLSALD